VGSDRAVAVIGPVKGDAVFRLEDFIGAQSMVRADLCRRRVVRLLQA
jgi:hypothetical protein